MTILKIESHKFSENQTSDDTFIARYMDFPEFISLLNGKIKFTSLEKLKEHDIFEFNFEPNQLKVDEEKRNNRDISSEEINKNIQNHDWAKHWFCSCWCYEKEENMALWKIFGSMGKGIRIETDVGSVRKSIKKEYWPEPFYAHKVDYKLNNNASDIYEAVYIKRSEFKYESEIRFSTQIYFHHNKSYQSILIDPELLIKKITIGPQVLWTQVDILKLVSLFGLKNELVSTSCYDILNQ